MSKIMVVDDDDSILRLISEIMRKEGYDVLQAVDGEEAFALFQQQPCDLVITDLLMPNKEGLELIQELRGIKPSLKIIAYSGGGQLEPDDYLDFARGVGADRVFSKPISIIELKQAVSQLLSEVE
ncbi:MAG TPA: response regulator [Aeromonadales bacterium]|nr:response regulator [Aeromonadales bacterium]